ncbi:MAG: GGDEF domain-containing protein [Gammaproteobacteria bacterium]|nr:GGDEF domain-containing protein [Gammaproteobacteria bacterium]
MSNDWKQKYLAKLDQFESKQKEWDELEEFLRQASSRLALAAEGSSKSLDKLLPKLRKSLRQGENQLKLGLIMDEVSDELIRLDKIKNSNPSQEARLLSALLKTLTLSPEMTDKSQKLQKLLENKSVKDENKLIKEFSTFFSQCLSISHKSGSNKQGQQSEGFFSRLLSTLADDKPASENNKTLEKIADATNDLPSLIPKDIKDPEEKEAFEKSVTATLQNILEVFIDSLDYPLAQRNLLKDQLFTIKPTKEVHVLLEELARVIRANNLLNGSNNHHQSALAHEILIQLLESIPLKAELKKQADALKKDFSKGIKNSDLPNALEAIAKLISKMQLDSHKEQKAFESFLVNVKNRLKEVDNYLSKNLSEHKDSWQKGIALGKKVTEQVKGIGKSFSQATDIKALENDVKSKINDILEHVDHYKQGENQRVKRVQQQNELLKKKIEQLEAESDQLKNTIVNSQREAYTDPLTGLPNRLAYEQFLAEEYARWKRYHENLLLMVWDIDYFKKVNDTYGHQAGDEVLTKVGQLLQSNLRETDFTARFGGEEFVSLLPNTSLGGGYKIAEKVRELIEQLDLQYKEQKISLTISCGISLFATNDTPDIVFERADKALYQAKSQGRNRCVIAQE